MSGRTTSVGYLRRRVRPRQGLGARDGRPARQPPVRVAGRLLLTPEVSTVTLDRRQSAMGCLVLELAGNGSLAAMWELDDTSTGLVSASSGQLGSAEFGGRAIVQLDSGRLVIRLRHVRHLRRVVVLVEDVASASPVRLVGTTYNGATADMSFDRSGPVVAAMAIYEVDGELVLRREVFDFPTAAAALAAYGMSISWFTATDRP